MNDMKKLYDERVKRIKDAMDLKEPDRVPIISTIAFWNISYAGYTIEEVMNDYSKAFDSYRKICEDFEWDGLKNASLTRSMKMFDMLGGNSYVYSEGGKAIQQKEIVTMESEEYPQLIANPVKFFTEVVLPRRYEVFSKSSKEIDEALEKSLNYFLEFMQYAGPSAPKLAQMYGMPTINRGVAIMPLDMLLDSFRGFKGITLDIRRRSDEVLAACEALVPIALRLAELSFGGKPGEAKDFPCVFIPIHIPPFLNPKQFEKFYWPSFKKVMDELTTRGYRPFCTYGGDWSAHYEHLQDLPEGKTVGLFEKGDLGQIKKVLGNTMCIAGGMPLQLLNYGTQQECIDYAKKIIDEVAPGGGYLFTTDKGLITENDGKAENITAVNKFVKEYGVYK